MNTPLTPGMSALLYIPEDNLDGYGNFPSQTTTSSPIYNFSPQQQYLSLDIVDNNAIQPNSHFNYAQNYPGGPIGLHNRHAVPDDNTFVQRSGNDPCDSTFSTSSMLDLPSNTTASTLQNFDTIASFTQLNNDYEYASESLQNNHQSFAENDLVEYGYQDTHNPFYGVSQLQYFYDSSGNIVSPLRVMNEQYEGQQIDDGGNTRGELEPAFLVPPPPLYNDRSTDFKPQSSVLSSAQAKSNLVPPPPLPPTAPAQPGDPPIKVKRRRRRKPPPPPEVAAVKHKAFLQRNREAASKCRTKKKAQINDLEDDERLGRQINFSLKHEFQDILGEVLALREQIKEMRCDGACDGCGEHAPMSRDTFLANSSVGTGSVIANSSVGTCSVREDDEEEEDDDEEDEDDVHAESVNYGNSPVSINSPLQRLRSINLHSNDEAGEECRMQPYNKRKGVDQGSIIFPDGDTIQAELRQREGQRGRQSSAYLEGYDRKNL